MDDVETIIEIRGLYDGWSWAVLKDGTAVNRWEPGDRRYAVAQQAVDAYTAGQLDRFGRITP